MKNLLLIAAFVLVSLSLIAQEAETTMPINGKTMEISVKKVPDGYKYSFKQINTPKPIPSYNTIDLNRDILLGFTKTAFEKINGSISNEDESEIKKNINNIFIELVAILMNENEKGPLIAKIKLNEVIPLYKMGTLTNYSLIPSDCYLVFKDGFIEQIKVYGEVKDLNLVNAQKKVDDTKIKIEKLLNDSINTLLEKENVSKKAKNARKNLNELEKYIEEKKSSQKAYDSIYIYGADMELSLFPKKITDTMATIKSLNEKIKELGEKSDSLSKSKYDFYQEQLKKSEVNLREVNFQYERLKSDMESYKKEIINNSKVNALKYDKMIDSAKRVYNEAVIDSTIKSNNYLKIIKEKKDADSILIIYNDKVLLTKKDESNKAELLRRKIDIADSHLKTADSNYVNAKENDKKITKRLARLIYKKTLEYSKVKKDSEAKKKLDSAILSAKKYNKKIAKKELKIAKNEVFIANSDYMLSNIEKYGFTNFYSIGISSLPNRKSLYQTQLYVDNRQNQYSYSIKLGDAINYQAIPHEGTRDYSPANGEITLTNGQEDKLYKSPNSKLLEFKVFTDAVGFGEETPNGLVQLELEKRVPIYTTRHGLYRSGFTWLSFIDFEFTYSKIENKVKYLQLSSYPPQNETTPQDSTVYYLDALQVNRQQIFQVGMKLNLLLIECQPYKLDFEINLHADFGYSRVLDTLVINNEIQNINAPINNFMFAPEVKFIFYPEKRLNFSISDKVTRQYFLYNNSKFGYNSIKENELIEGSKWFNTVSLDAYYWASDQGKIFVRYSFNHELENVDNNYNQFQIGYSMYLKTSKKD